MDRELEVIASFLEDIATTKDVREHCPSWRTWEKKGRSHQQQQPHHTHHHHHGGSKKDKSGKRAHVQAG